MLFMLYLNLMQSLYSTILHFQERNEQTQRNMEEY